MERRKILLRYEVNGKVLELVRGDIIAQEVDAIVNAANSGLRGGGGVDGAIHRAGGPDIMRECRQLGGCPTGEACVTTAGRLKARYVIHAVGPVWSGGGRDEPALLAGAYRHSLKLAAENGLESIAFPSISTGAYRYPLAEAAAIAINIVIEHLKDETSVKRVIVVLFNDAAYQAYSEALEAVRKERSQNA